MHISTWFLAMNSDFKGLYKYLTETNGSHTRASINDEFRVMI